MKRWLKIIGWSAFTLTVLVMMGMTKTAQLESEAGDPDILVEVDGEDTFLTKDELMLVLKRKGLVFPGQLFRQVDVAGVEAFIESMSEVSEARVYTNLGGSWNIYVKMRKPIARIFNNSGESFYLDETGHIMAPSHLHTARIVVVTGDIPDRKNSMPVSDIINNDTLKSIRILDDIYRISGYVCNDPFLRAQIGQIYREKNGDFILIPQVGAQKIIFGTARTEEEVADKFGKLVIFYKEGLPFEGWNKYVEINLKYEKQIVCKKREID